MYLLPIATPSHSALLARWYRCRPRLEAPSIAPDADGDADANGADNVIDDNSDRGDSSEDAATHATTPAFDADAACRHLQPLPRRRRRQTHCR